LFVVDSLVVGFNPA